MCTINHNSKKKKLYLNHKVFPSFYYRCRIEVNKVNKFWQMRDGNGVTWWVGKSYFELRSIHFRGQLIYIFVKEKGSFYFGQWKVIRQ